jgi:hypothetical protein
MILSRLKVRLPKYRLYVQSLNHLRSTMNSIDTRIAIGGMATRLRAVSKPDSQPVRLPVNGTAAKSVSDNTRPDPVLTTASFSTYGSHNERICIVVKNKEKRER